MHNLKSQTRYFTNLDAFRFFAFLGVFLSHTFHFASTNQVWEFIISIITLNCLGVPFFFTLSSFLITYRLLNEKKENKCINLLNFYRNRILRIWPAYFFLIAICYLLLPVIAYFLKLEAPTLPPLIPLVLFYLNFYIIENGGNFTFALLILWSISIEEQFYLVWGLIMKLTTKKYLSVLIFFLFVFSLCFSYIYLHNPSKSANNLAIHSFYVLQNFCTGAIMAVICFYSGRSMTLLNKIPTAAIASVYIILPVVYFLIADMVLLNAIKSICYGVIIFDQTFNKRRLFEAGKNSFINYLGKISYGLYIYHAFVFVVLQKSFRFFIYSGDQSILINLFHIIITLSITVAVSHVSYKYIELKFLKLKT